MLETLSMEDKVVVITGGGTGLGLAMVRAMARAGASICAAGRRQAPIDAAAAEVTALGQDALAVSTDVTDSGQVDRLMETALEKFGRIDVLINNAGAVQENVRKPLWEITDDEWNFEMNVKLDRERSIALDLPHVQWPSGAREKSLTSRRDSACGEGGTSTCIVAAREA